MCSSWAAIPGVSTPFGTLMAAIPGRESTRRGTGEPVAGVGEGIVQKDQRVEPLMGVVVLTPVCPTERDGKRLSPR